MFVLLFYFFNFLLNAVGIFSSLVVFHVADHNIYKRNAVGIFSSLVVGLSVKISRCKHLQKIIVN